MNEVQKCVKNHLSFNEFFYFFYSFTCYTSYHIVFRRGTSSAFYEPDGTVLSNEQDV